MKALAVQIIDTRELQMITGFDNEQLYYNYIIAHYDWIKTTPSIWEPPLWVAYYNGAFSELSYTEFDKANHVGRLIEHVVIEKIERVGFSLMAWNEVTIYNIVKELVNWSSCIIDIGLCYGSEDSTIVHELSKLPNVVFYRDIRELVDGNRPTPTYAAYNTYIGHEHNLTRIATMEGCTMGCAFCTIPSKVDVFYKREIESQYQLLKDGKKGAGYIYIDDKTADVTSPDYISKIEGIRKSAKEILGKNPLIIGQTTVRKLKAALEAGKDLPFDVIEVGVEFYHNGMYVDYKKQLTTQVVDELMQLYKNYEYKFMLVPNLIITGANIVNIRNFIDKYKGMFPYINLNRLADYSQDRTTQRIDNNHDAIFKYALQSVVEYSKQNK